MGYNVYKDDKLARVSEMRGQNASREHRRLEEEVRRDFAAVRRGEELVVTDRGKPVARIVPLDTDDVEPELAELIALGMVRPRKTREPLPKSFWTDPLAETTIDLTELIREDRDAR